MHVLQVLPELNSGGVERGTVDFARELVMRGHRSTVISNGGRMVPLLEQQGSRHIQYPVHRKSLLSLRHIRPLRRLILEMAPDVVHVRSRLPAWLVWLALKDLPRAQRPALVSTFHGLYSVNRYSEIMGCGDAIIAISDCVADYIQSNYPRINPAKISVVHRGVDTDQFRRTVDDETKRRNQFYRLFPQCEGKVVLTMPGRLSRWKGQLEFLVLVHDLINRGVDCHGLVVGDITPGKESYREELRREIARLHLNDTVTLTGHIDDMDTIYRFSSVTYNLSNKPEPFGRTVIESLAVGTPVIAYDCGGPAESLRDCLPQGLVAAGDSNALAVTTQQFIQHKPDFSLPDNFTLRSQAEKTLSIYEKLLN